MSKKWSNPKGKKTNNKLIMIKEIEKSYRTNRTKWIKQYGSDKGFDTWFTKQITKAKYVIHPKKIVRVI